LEECGQQTHPYHLQMAVMAEAVLWGPQAISLVSATRVAEEEAFPMVLVVPFSLAPLVLVGMAALPVRAMSGLTATGMAKAVAAGL
jgi:hypothetical protein